jgi:hypothetical protein
MTDWAPNLYLLRTALDAITQYTENTGRLGMHDLALLETLRGQAGLTVPADEAMARMVETDERVFIGGPKGTEIWDGVDEDTAEILDRLGLLHICDRHEGPWGDDETCPRCTHLDGTPRALDAPGPLADEDE